MHTHVDLLYVCKRIHDTLRMFSDSPDLCASQLADTVTTMIDSAYSTNMAAMNDAASGGMMDGSDGDYYSGGLYSFLIPFCLAI